MRYVILMNNKYLNSFSCYGDAFDYRDKYQKMYPDKNVEIITYEEFKGSKVNISSNRYWTYKVIEYTYISMSHDDSGDKIEVCKTLHKQIVN